LTEPGRSFDRAAEEYERGRPGYPDGIMDVVPVAPPATVLDLAAGTGKLTRVLARRYARVIAVEPLAALRAIVERVAELHRKPRRPRIRARRARVAAPGGELPVRDARRRHVDAAPVNLCANRSVRS
jgi:SAM-dependent methyltransferase